MQKLKSSSTAFEIWYENLLDKILQNLQKGLNYILPLDQVRSAYKKLFDVNIFKSDIYDICSNNNLRAICYCKSKRFYIFPI